MSILRRAAASALLAAILPSGAIAQPPLPTGLYRAVAGPDTASMIELAPDGRFRYQMSEGALDEESSGRWTQTADGVTLLTLPRPRPPEFRMGPIGEDKATAFSLKVILQGSGPLAGVYVRVGFTNGDRQAASTQDDGWSLPPDETRQPAWFELSEPIHGVASPRFDLPDDRHMAVTVTLTPNDIGVADFTDTPVTISGNKLVLHWRGRDIAYERARPTERAQPNIRLQ